MQNVPEAPKFSSAVITIKGKNFKASQTSPGNYQFQAVPSGIQPSGFRVTIDSPVDPVTQVTVGGADASDFSATITNKGYTLSMTAPKFSYNHSAGGQPHQYQFSLTLGALGSSTGATVWTFTIPMQNPFAGGSGTSLIPTR